MSTNTLTTSGSRIPKPVADKENVINFKPELEEETSLAEKQIDEILQRSLWDAGFPQPMVSTEVESIVPPEELPKHIIAPGISVTNEEFKQRFEGIDLEKYRQQMSPELFRMFIRHVGSIPGISGLELAEFITTPE